ncbi:hypothetical protein Q8F55_008575 [Vanrija albida]|uniref:Uncharacterized protein n=1 Tax=Vanrija albida TaxID=181172 RepID=A0ABR3PR81_9TREE
MWQANPTHPSRQPAPPTRPLFVPLQLPDPTRGPTREEHARDRQRFLERIPPAQLAPIVWLPRRSSELPSFGQVLAYARLAPGPGPSPPVAMLEPQQIYENTRARSPATYRRFAAGDGWDQPWYFVEDASSRQPPLRPVLRTMGPEGALRPPGASHLLERVTSVPSGLLVLLAESQGLADGQSTVVLPPYLYRLRVACEQCRAFGAEDCFVHDVLVERGRVARLRRARCLRCMAEGDECSLPDALCDNGQGEHQLRPGAYDVVEVRRTWHGGE